MKNFKFIKSGFCEKLKLLLIPIGLLIGSLTTQVWADSWSYNLSFYCIPGEIFADNDEYHDMAYRQVSVGANDGTGTWREAKMTATGVYYKGYEIYSATLTCWAYKDKEGGASNIWIKLRHADTWSTEYGGLQWSEWREMSYINGYIRTASGWDIYKYDHTISAGSTIIWDMAGNESMWGASYLYKDINGGSASNDAMTNVTGTKQYYITYANAINYVASFQFRSNTNNWNDYSHTTNIERNVSGVTLFTNLNNATGSPAKLNWQVSENAKKASGGVKIYFDNTAANWSAIWLKYGTTWYNRKSASAASKVYGTDNLYVIEMPTDIYYAKYYLADNFGWVNYSDIEAAGDAGNLMSNRIASQESDLTSDITFIPSTGNSSTPKVWTTTTMSGHTHTVTVGNHDHGTITLSYTDENNTEQHPTVTTDVARTCYVSASASADNGYDYTSMTLGSSSYTPNTSIIITKDTTFAATFTAHTYSITLDKGDHGAADGSATVVFNTSALASSTLVSANPGYRHEGYYDGNTKVLNADGSFAETNVSGYITGGKWSKYDAGATLTAKFSPVELTFKSDASTSAWGTATNWNPACVPTIEHDVVLKKSAVVSGGTTAAAKSVKIDGSSSTVKLTIESTGALIVAEDIKAMHEGEDSYGATNENDLRIESDYDGNGTLIVGNASTNTMASYQAYSKSWYVSGGYGYINQYIGIPFDELYAYQYYGRILYEYDGESDRWKASSTTMEAFKAYNILSKTDSYDYFYLDGTLNLPGKDDVGRLKTLTCGDRIGEGTTEDEGGDYMFANSWTAPIYITAMTEADFDGVAQAIYIFNAGSINKGTGAPGALGSYPGQWTVIPVDDPDDLDVIPSTQAFLVKNLEDGGTLTLDYNKHVYAPAKSAVDKGEDISTEPIRAPKHNQTNDNPSTRLNIIVRADSIYSDHVRIHKRADFTNGYDDGWEGAKIFGIAAAPQLYAISDIGRMAVNAVPEIEGMVIGFTKGSTDDTYTMSFEYDGEEALYLNDLKEQTSTLIAADNSYQFTSAANDTEARFVISCTPIAHTPTGVSDINNQQSAARKLMIDGKLYIIRDGGIYDATGTMVK